MAYTGAAIRAVLRFIETRPLEDNTGRKQHTTNRAVALWAHSKRIIGHMLPGFKVMSTLAARILIRRHLRSASLTRILKSNETSETPRKRPRLNLEILSGWVSLLPSLCSVYYSTTTERRPMTNMCMCSTGVLGLSIDILTHAQPG